MVLHILNYVSTSDVLRNCRLISRTWTHAATTICQNRRVRCRTNKARTPLSESDYNPFRQTIHFPWSSITFESLHDEFERQLRITALFSSTIQHLTLESFGYNHCVQILAYLPHLKTLNIFSCHSFETWLDSPSEDLAEVTLCQLREASISSRAYAVPCKLLQLIFKQTQASLEKISYKFSHKDDEIPVQIMDTLLTHLKGSRVRRLELTVPYQGPNAAWKLLATQQQLILEKVHIELSGFGIPETEYFLPLEQFLSKSTNLRSLKLKNFFSCRKWALDISKNARVPQLPVLKELELQFEAALSSIFEPPQGMSFLDFTPLKASSFPALRKVRIQFSGSSAKSPLNISKCFSGDCKEDSTFESVETLELVNCNGGQPGNWVKNFPNVRNLLVNLKDAEGLVAIFQNAFSLATMTVTLEGISGNYDKWMEGIFNKASTFQASNLERLEIVFPRDEALMLTENAALYFTKLPSLDLHITSSFTLMEICVEKLVQHHIRFHHTFTPPYSHLGAYGTTYSRPTYQWLGDADAH